MGKILYNEKTVLDFKSTMERCNSEIIDAIGKIQNELITIDKTLNTPNANKVIASCQEQVNNDLNYVRNMRESYNNALNNINNEYHNYLDSVHKTVGDNSDNKL